MRMTLLSVVLGLATLGGLALTPSTATAGPNWGRRPIYANGEFLGYTYAYPTNTNARFGTPGGYVPLPASYYYEPPVYVSPGNTYQPNYYYGNGGYYPSRGFYGRGQ